jgi:hypothetical protein
MPVPLPAASVERSSPQSSHRPSQLLIGRSSCPQTGHGGNGGAYTTFSSGRSSTNSWPSRAASNALPTT